MGELGEKKGWWWWLVNIQDVDDSSSWAEEDDDASSVSSSSSTNSLQLAPFDPSAETLSERLYALRDIIPPSTRAALSDSAARTASWVKWTGLKAGNAAWIVTTSALLVGLPFLLTVEGEAAMMAQEKEYLGQQQGAQAAYGQQPGGAQPTGIVPPGF